MNSLSLRAVIDVGTNSIKLLVAEVRGDQIFPIIEQSEQTRLGAGFYQTHQLQPKAIESTVLAVKEYAGRAREAGVESIRIIATSAARDAENAEVLTRQLETVTGIEVEVISGDTEAEWVFRGVTSDGRSGKQPTVILDVGGGSTEIILGDNGHSIFAKSFRLGTVRLLEKFLPHDPPLSSELPALRTWLSRMIASEIAPALIPLLGQREWDWVGTGGTSTILAKLQGGLDGFDREIIERTRISRPDLLKQLNALWGLSHSDRETIPGLPAQRADVILMGTAIYAAVMEQFQVPQIRISTRGIRYAALIENGWRGAVRGKAACN